MHFPVLVGFRRVKGSGGRIICTAACNFASFVLFYRFNVAYVWWLLCSLLCMCFRCCGTLSVVWCLSGSGDEEGEVLLARSPVRPSCILSLNMERFMLCCRSSSWPMNPVESRDPHECDLFATGRLS